MKRIYTLALVACSVGALSLTSCEDALDKMNLGSTSEELIFADSALAQMNIDYIYDQNLPSWGPTNTVGGINLSNLSDESAGESKFFEGTLQVNDVTDFGTGLK